MLEICHNPHRGRRDRGSTGLPGSQKGIITAKGGPTRLLMARRFQGQRGMTRFGGHWHPRVSLATAGRGRRAMGRTSFVVQHTRQPAEHQSPPRLRAGAWRVETCLSLPGCAARQSRRPVRVHTPVRPVTSEWLPRLGPMMAGEQIPQKRLLAAWLATPRAIGMSTAAKLPCLSRAGRQSQGTAI